ncbi:MAG: ATP-binding protein [Hungatella sp.]|nr:ATP-binding protein [Hungatella sp.]
MGLSNSQYNAIMRIYNQRQFQNKDEQDKRVKEVYDRLPQIRQIDDAISTQAVACARRLLEGDKGARDVLRRQLEDLREQKAVLLKAYGYRSDYMELQYHCPQCQDTGYVEGKKCHCFKKEEISLLYSQSNIQDILAKENFSTFTFDYYDNKEVIPQIGMTVAGYMRQVHGWCREYVEGFKNKGGNLIFTGSTGVGKTFLTNCIAKELIDGYQSVIYLSANDLFDIFSKNKFHYGTEEEMRDMYQYILDCDLLIIDDLGTELNNTFVSSQLFYCINERMIRKKGTIISTNLSIDMLRDTYSDRISSRIISQYTIIPLYGGDIRLKLGS